VIEARGSKGGKVVRTEKRETTGKVETIALSADRTEIDANGEDIAVVRVEGRDKEGRLVPTADNGITFKVSGEGALVGLGNGDPNCQEADKPSENHSLRSLFNGLAQVILQANKTPGTIVLEAYTEPYPGPKLPSARLDITTKKVIYDRRFESGNFHDALS
jgi:beta-galactosidase